MTPRSFAILDKLKQYTVAACLSSAVVLCGPIRPIQAEKPDHPNELAKFWGTDRLVEIPAEQRFSVLGATSCAASGCHGGPAVGVSSVDAPRGSEYPLWLESDPHAKSWRTINSPKSIDIMERLGILVEGKLANRSAFQNCLACHNTSKDLSSDELVPTRPEGVGCESCHGPAEAWKDSHYQGAASVQNAIDKLGLVDSKSELRRARMCTLCHVGGPDRDMNHDIIAAGHPALYFDYSTYLAAYPKHWRDPALSTQDAQLVATQRWLIGQFAKADSELELIHSRISHALPNSVWPEFSNFQCTSCHQTIEQLPHQNDSKNRGANQVLGQAPVRLWNLEGLKAAESALLNSSIPLSPSSSLLNDLQASKSSTGSALDSIQLEREKLMASLRSSVGKSTRQFFPPWNVESQKNWAKSQWEKANEAGTWESFALAYLATLPVSATGPAFDPNKTDLIRSLKTLRSGLLFPPDTQSPIFPRDDRTPEPPTKMEWKSSLDLLIHSLEKY